MADGNDQTLIKIAVFGITMSLIATFGIAILIAPNADYSYDDITKYRSELVSFSGESMINQTPWVLTHVYTPWVQEMGYENHIDDDGWLFGTDVTTYDQIGKSADIKLDPDQKSSTLLSIGDPESYTYVSGQWSLGDDFIPGGGGYFEEVFGKDIISALLDAVGVDRNIYTTVDINRWNYTGYRFVFDPTLPYSNGNAAEDGSLSLVWYSFNGEEGLSGGLDVYGGDVILASYSAYDIIGAYESVGGYAKQYDFDFEGRHLTLSVRFDPDKTAQGYTLMECWTNGWWSMAISTVSAGNFYDLENSASFVNTAGSVVDTFTQIYTMSLPSIDNPWMDLVLWLLVGLPMTIAMLCVALRFVQSIKIL